MSKIVTSNVVVGQSGTASNNFLIDTDSAGAWRLRRNSDGSGGTLLVVDSSGGLQLGATSGANAEKMVLSTAQTTTAGTAIDFTSIPSWVKRITVLFNGVSTNGSNIPQVQIGAGSMTTTGYASSGATNGTSLGSFTTGFPLGVGGNPAYIFAGSMTICTLGSNVWVMSGSIGTGSFSSTVGGNLTLSGTLDRLRLTTVGGTDTFDAGSVNILYEGY